LPLAVGAALLELRRSRPWWFVRNVLSLSTLVLCSYLSQALSKHVTHRCAYPANRTIGGREIWTEIRRLARDIGSVAHQGIKSTPKIHLFEMCMAAPGQAYEYLTTMSLSTLIRQCFRGSAHNWTPTHHQPGTPYLLQREHVDAVIQNWRGGPEFAAVQMPANANNILSDKVQHWVNTNLTVYSTYVTQVSEWCCNIANVL
jgi:hypothetical protein